MRAHTQNCIQRNSPGFLASAYTVARHSDDRNLSTQKQINFEIRHCRWCCGCVSLHWKRYSHSHGHRHCRWKHTTSECTAHSIHPRFVERWFPVVHIVIIETCAFLCAENFTFRWVYVPRIVPINLWGSVYTKRSTHRRGEKREKKAHEQNKIIDTNGNGRAVDIKAPPRLPESFIRGHEHAGTHRRRAHRQSHPIHTNTNTRNFDKYHVFRALIPWN